MPAESVPLPPRASLLRVLAFGDSITEGVMARRRDGPADEFGDFGTNSVASAWACRLGELLGDDDLADLGGGLGAEVSVVSFGRQGWST